MNAWKLLPVALACLAATACNSDPNRVYMERDLRRQEDQIYQLQDCVDDYEAELESCRRENATLHRRLAEATAGRPLDEAAPKGGARPGPVAGAPLSIQVPDEPLSPPARLPASPPASRPASTGRERPAAAPASNPPPATRETPSEDGPLLGGALSALGLGGKAAEVIAGDSRQVASIVLNSLLTGGYKQKNRYGHEGVMVVIEPRDAKGRLIAAPADLSIVVVDPKIAGEAGRIARWDFDSKETEPLFRRTGLAPGFQVELPWPANPPTHNELHLFVRYMTSDGRKLQADRPIKVELLDEPDKVADRPAPAGVPAHAAGQKTEAAVAAREEPPTEARTAEPAPRIGENRDTDDAGDAAAAEERPTKPPSVYAGRGDSRPKTTSGLQRPVWSPERK